jgi:hypothetical protein
LRPTASNKRRIEPILSPWAQKRSLDRKSHHYRDLIETLAKNLIPTKSRNIEDRFSDWIRVFDYPLANNYRSPI